MRRFAIKTCPYACIILLFGIWVELRAREIPNNYSLKAQKFESFPVSEIETLVLGSSHTFKGINPTYLSSTAFNYAHVSQSYDIDLAILESSDFKKLKTIILPVSQFSLYTVLGEGAESHRLGKYSIYTTLDVSTSYFDYFSVRNWTEYRSLIFSGIDSSLCTIEPNGWEPNPMAPDKDFLMRTARTAFTRHSRHGLNFHAIALDSFEKIVRWSKTHNVLLILISMPGSHEYSRLVSNSMQWQQTKKKLKDFKSIQFLNWLESPPVEFSEGDFYDADHLSLKGAEKVSKELNKRIEEFHREIQQNNTATSK